MKRLVVRTNRHPVRALLVMGTLLVAAGLGPALAHSYKHGDIAVGHAWAPPTETDAGAVYLPLLNRGDAPDRLVGGSTPIATEVRIRIEKDGTVSWPDAIELAPGKPISLAAWRQHLWLVGLDRPLKEGERLPMILEFEKAGPVEIEIFSETTPGQ